MFVPGLKHESFQLTVNLSYKRRHIDLPAQNCKQKLGVKEYIETLERTISIRVMAMIRFVGLFGLRLLGYDLVLGFGLGLLRVALSAQLYSLTR